MAEDLQEATAALLAADYGGEGLEVLLQRVGTLRKGAELYAAASVHDARVLRGESWDVVAAAAQVSESTARARWSDMRVRRQFDQWMTARLQEAATGPSRLEGAREGEDGGEAWRRAQLDASQKIALALVHLQRGSGLSVRKVAARTLVSASYVSRVLSGDRLPSWEVLQTVTRVLGGVPEDLRLLWETATGYLPPSRRPVHLCAARFHAAVRGFHLASGCQDPAQLVSACDFGLSEEVLRSTLEGRLVPDWVTTGKVVTVLKGYPALIRPLWEAVHYAFLAGHDIFPRSGLPLTASSPDDGSDAAVISDPCAEGQR